MHVLIDRIAGDVQPLCDDRHGFLIGEGAALIEHADDAHAVGLLHQLRLLAHGADALAQKLLELTARILQNRLLQLAAGRRDFGEHLRRTNHVGDVHVDAQREMEILADDVERRTLERPSVAGEHQLVGVVLLLVNRLVVIADIAEDIRRRADLARGHRAMIDRKNRMTRPRHIMHQRLTIRAEHRRNAAGDILQKGQHLFTIHIQPPFRTWHTSFVVD